MADTEKWTKASKELAAAEEEYREADNARARAISRLRNAERICHQLFMARMNLAAKEAPSR